MKDVCVPTSHFAPPVLRPNRQRRLYLAALPVFGAALVLSRGAQANPRIAVEVWKDPNCGCCKDWITHMTANGFAVTVHDTGNTAIRARLGMPKAMASCHTALVGGYVLEGHVPATSVHALLKKKPAALGLAVPGMPVGSPGMDGPEYGGRRDPYDVLLVARNGGTKVFESFRS